MSITTTGLFILFLLGYTFLGNNISDGLRCYTCDSAGKNKCEDFDPANENFSKECPSDESVSCITILLNGTVMFRDCESHNLSVCSIANDIEYCYCPKELCNGRRLPSGDDDDDEDDNIEGSGIFFPPSTSIPAVTFSVTHQEIPIKSNACCYLKVQLVLLFLTQYFVCQYYY